MNIVRNEAPTLEKRAAIGARSGAVRGLSFLVGVSTIALLATGVSAPAWAQAVTGSGPEQVPNPTQEAAPGADSTATAKDVISAGEVVVTGRRAALQNADDRKRRSETIIDSVVADDAGKLPDNSITEVLQRVAGVSIVRFAALGNPDAFSVEGSGIQVRGLSGVASRLNGREIFSANNGRAILWGDVTPELMSAVDVYKASTADLIEGGTGGQIDLRTKLPFDFKGGLHVAGSGELSEGDLAKKKDPSVSAMITDRFHTPLGDIGILADLAYSRLSSLSDFFRSEPYFKTHINNRDYFIPGGYTYGDQYYQRKRTGIYGAVQWAPAESLTFTATFFQTRYKEDSTANGAFVTSQNLAVDPAQSTFDSNNGLLSSTNVFVRDPATFLPSGSITTGTDAGGYQSSATTRDYSLSFQWKPSDKPISISGALQRVDSTARTDNIDIFGQVTFPGTYGITFKGKSIPEVTVPGGTQAVFDDPASYQWVASMPHSSDNKGRLTSGNLDAEYSFDDSFFRSVKIGGRYAKRTERDFDNGYNWTALGRGWNGDPQLSYANAAAGDVAFQDFKNFFHGDVELPARLMYASQALVQKSIHSRIPLVNSPPAGFCSDAQLFDCSASGPLPVTGYGGLSGIRAPGFILPGDQVDNSTETEAGYALVRFGSAGGGGIAGNVGVRVVHLRNEGSGYISQNASEFILNGQDVTIGQQFIARGGTATFTRVLPSVNLDFAPSPKTKIRFGYNITMDNASYTALRASGSIGVATSTNPVAGGPGIFTNFTADTGNPLLKPTMSNNLDLSFEYYGRAGTTLHVAPFYKHLTNLPIYSATQRAVTVVFTDGTSLDTVANATDYINSSKAATIKGVEVGGRLFFDKLPGLLSGFGVEANYTYISSKNPGDVYRDISGIQHADAPVVGLSRHNYNATLLYERKRVSARIAYSWRSKYLQTTNSNGTNPSYPFYSGPGVVSNANGTATSTQIALPIYGDAYGTLDAGVRFKFNDHLSVGVQATNLTNATARTLMGGYPGGTLYVRSWFQSDRRISGQISLAF
jgi:iron complex outermembrane receptor protein